VPRKRKGPSAADSTDYVRCRTLGHSWDPIPVTEPPSYGVAIDLRCEHCFTVRRDIVSRTSAALLSRRYSYPDHYRDTEHYTRTDWRGLWVTTLAEHLRAIGAEPEPDEAEAEPKRARPVRSTAQVTNYESRTRHAS
jgi:hypothetical protein